MSDPTPNTSQEKNTSEESKKASAPDDFGLRPEDYQKEWESLSFEQFQDLRQKSVRYERVLEQLQRTQADFDNYQKRVAREKESWSQMAQVSQMNSVLRVFDSFYRALESAEKTSDFNALYEGLKLVYQDIQKLYLEQGITEVEAVGKPYDPATQEALMQQPSADHPAGTVLSIFQKGFMLKNRLIRPAKVVVSKKPD